MLLEKRPVDHRPGWLVGVEAPRPAEAPDVDDMRRPHQLRKLRRLRPHRRRGERSVARLMGRDPCPDRRLSPLELGPVGGQGK